MKKIINTIVSLVLTSTMAMGLLATPVFADSNSGNKIIFDKKNIALTEDQNHAKDHVLVLTKNCLDGVKLSHHNASKTISQIFSGDEYTAYRVYLNDGYDAETAIRELNKEDYVLYCEPDYEDVTDQGGTDYDYDNPYQWHHQAIHTFEAWEQLDKLPSVNRVRVAIIDGTFNIMDPDIYPCVNMTLSGDFSSGSKKGVNWTAPKNDHATHCAGLIAARPDNGNDMIGVAAGSKNNRIELVCLSTVQMSDAALLKNSISSTSAISNVAAAIVYASENKCKIASISMGTVYPSKVLEAAVSTAKSNGMLLVCAAGNTGTDTTIYPACYDSVVSVANLCTRSGNLTRASSSTYGKIDLSAPGTAIYSLDSNYGTSLMTGTSMACPIVAGTIALVMSSNKNITPEEAYQFVKDTAIDVDSYGFDNQTGYGCVNAYEAVRAAVKKYAPSYYINKTVSDGDIPTVSDELDISAITVAMLFMNAMGNIPNSNYYSALEADKMLRKETGLVEFYDKVFSSHEFWIYACKLSDSDFVNLVYKVAFGHEANSSQLNSALNYMSKYGRVKTIGYIISSTSARAEFAQIYENMKIGNFYDSKLFWVRCS